MCSVHGLHVRTLRLFIHPPTELEMGGEIYLVSGVRLIFAIVRIFLVRKCGTRKIFFEFERAKLLKCRVFGFGDVVCKPHVVYYLRVCARLVGLHLDPMLKHVLIL